MARKKWFLLIDTETTQTGMVADFGAVIMDKQGRIDKEMGVLVGEFFSDKENHPLFHIYGDANDIFSKASLPKRYANYENMLRDGRRMLASRAAVNRWLVKAALHYRPTLTAYNLAFDLGKCENSGIDLSIFDNQFCLWKAAVAKWANTKSFKRFMLENHNFGNKTKTGGMTIKTNAEVMARFVLNDPTLKDEPHTALEDAKYYEAPILSRLVSTTSPREYMEAPPFNWRHWQLRDHYTVK